MNRSVQIVALFLLVVTFSGCASLSKDSGFGVQPSQVSETQQPWQGHAAQVPGVASEQDEYLVDALKKINVLTVSLDPVNNWWLADGIQHVNDEGEIYYADVWRALVIKPDGQTIEASSILGDATGNGFISYTMLPGIKPEEMKDWKLIRISAAGEMVMTTKGRVIGLMSPDPASRESVDIEKLKSDEKYRNEFFSMYPSPITRVTDFSPDTEAGKKFLAYLSAKYPASKRFQGASYLVSPEANSMAGESPRHSYLDKFITAESVVLGPGLAAWPIGPATFAASFIYSAWHATRVPSYGSMNDSFTKPEVAAAWAELMDRHVVARIAQLERGVVSLQSALQGKDVLSWDVKQ